MMYHEATACHVTGDLVELLSITLLVLRCASKHKDCKGMVLLTAHNSQKGKSIFLPCPRHKIYRVEAVGLKNSNYTKKIRFF